MERLIIIMTYSDDVYGNSDTAKALVYETKEKFVSDLSDEMERINSILRDLPKPEKVVIADYEMPNGLGRVALRRDLKPHSELKALMESNGLRHTAIKAVKDTFKFENALEVTFDGLMGGHEITVYTVDEFFNDPDRIITL